MHVYDFITDQEQYNLKSIARKINPDSAFESILDTYRQLFEQGFDELSVTVESRYLKEPLKSDPGVQRWLQDFLKIILIDRKNIFNLLDDLFNVYELFIGGKHQMAVSLFYHLLEKYELLDNVPYEMLGCFFRGRFIKDGENIMEESYYFHIPFNKRFLIQNQRFSFSGLPLLYAGESLISTFYELGARDLEDRRIAIASFNYDHLARRHFDKSGEFVRNRHTIFDITNSIYDVINDLFF